MQTRRWFFVVLFSLSCSSVLPAQKEQRQPLSDAQIEAIREAGIYPNDRINLFTKYVDEHAQTIKGLSNRSKSTARAKKLDNELEDITALMDELGDNLDQYADRKADVRDALKKLNEAAPQWVRILNALAGEPTFDESRKEAIESCEDLADDAKRLMTEQIDYFNQHKDEKGQQRAEPK
jgi:methyl-accepting chemotaxis protein